MVVTTPKRNLAVPKPSERKPSKFYRIKHHKKLTEVAYPVPSTGLSLANSKFVPNCPQLWFGYRDGAAEATIHFGLVLEATRAKSTRKSTKAPAPIAAVR